MKFPSDENLIGAATALIRLQDVYNLDTAGMKKPRKIKYFMKKSQLKGIKQKPGKMLRRDDGSPDTPDIPAEKNIRSGACYCCCNLQWNNRWIQWEFVFLLTVHTKLLRQTLTASTVLRFILSSFCTHIWVPCTCDSYAINTTTTLLE